MTYLDDLLVIDHSVAGLNPSCDKDGRIPGVFRMDLKPTEILSTSPNKDRVFGHDHTAQSRVFLPEPKIKPLRELIHKVRAKKGL